MTKAHLSMLISRAKIGDPKAQGELILLTEARLFKFCFLLGHNRELAEDLCQEVYLKAFKNMSQLQNEEAFPSWLYQMAKNLFIDTLRSQTKISLHDEINPVASEPNFEVVLHVQQILSQFAMEDRYLLLLIEVEGLTYKEVAELTGATEGAMRSKLHRLRLEFAKKLK